MAEFSQSHKGTAQPGRSKALLKRMSEIIPGAANSNDRCGSSIVVSHGQGAELVDVDGNRYIDYILGFGPALLGHSHPEVTQAVTEAMQKGATFAFSHELELQVAEKIVSMYPSMEMVRLCNSGTDAGTTAYRIACMFTGRSMAVKIEGDYNGGYDVLLHNIPGVDLGNQVAMPVPGSTGIDSWATKLVASAPFNNTAALERIFDENRGKVAALFMEPVLGNTAAIMPAPGYLRSVRDLCDRHGILLVFDEVKTGFRMALGGAQEYFGVYSDLTMLGKAIANGLPLAAVGGKRELMQLVRAEAVHHCGTYFGNLPCVAAANAALSALRASDYESLMQRGSRLSAGICELLAAAGIPAYYHGVGSMFGITVGPQRPNDYRSWWLHTDREYWCQIARQLEKLGVLTDGFIGLFFLSFAHTDEQIGRTLTMCEDAIRYCQSIRQNHAS